jgi:S-adenosylhomocysteine hydrolase
MNIREWLVLYVKHKDIVKRSLVKVEDGKDHVTFTFKDGVVLGYAMEHLEAPKQIKGRAIIACLHTKQNIDFLIAHWKDFAAHAELTVILANPEKNEKIIIHTQTHDSVSEGNVELGIRTMAESVPFV